VRDRVRHHWLDKHFSPETLATAPQWLMVALFLSLGVLALAVTGYLTWVWLRSRLSDGETPPEPLH
jgi:hypothetical protein